MLVIGRDGIEELRAHGEEGYPDEVCGVLLGEFDNADDDGQPARCVREVHRAKNLNKERANDRYELDPNDYRAIEERARREGFEVLGIYHTHPDHPSEPSETDRQRAAEIWQDAESWSYLIIEVAGGKVASQRSWVLRDQQFEPEPIEIADDVDTACRRHAG